jgi:hypothetical protein
VRSLQHCNNLKHCCLALQPASRLRHFGLEHQQSSAGSKSNDFHVCGLTQPASIALVTPLDMSTRLQQHTVISTTRIHPTVVSPWSHANTVTLWSHAAVNQNMGPTTPASGEHTTQHNAPPPRHTLTAGVAAAKKLLVVVSPDIHCYVCWPLVGPTAAKALYKMCDV